MIKYILFEWMSSVRDHLSWARRVHVRDDPRFARGTVLPGDAPHTDGDKRRSADFAAALVYSGLLPMVVPVHLGLEVTPQEKPGVVESGSWPAMDKSRALTSCDARKCSRS